MLRHHHVTNHLEFVLLCRTSSKIFRTGLGHDAEPRNSSTVATTGDVVEVATSVPAASSLGMAEFYTPFERGGWKFCKPTVVRSGL